MAIIEFGGWTPDLPDLGNEGMLVAKNVFPLSRGYGPVPAPIAYPGPSALSARVVGAFSAKDKSANTYNYAATFGATNDGKLHRLVGTVWTDSSGNGGDATPGYNFADGYTVEWVKWGESVIAGHILEPLQTIDFGGSSFSNLVTSSRKPQFKHLAVLRDFVVGGNCDDVGNDGLSPNRVWWSGIGDPATFEDGTGVTQSDYQDLQVGGEIRKVIGGETGRIFCETAIYRLTYLGYSPWFQIDQIAENKGAWVSGSVAVFGRSAIFLDRDGWYLHDGEGVRAIGINKIDEFFLADFDSSFDYRCSSLIDPVRKVYHFLYPSVSAMGGIPDRLLCYDIVNDRWAITETTGEWLTLFLGIGYTLDSLDSLSSSIDALEVSLDSPTYQSKGQELAIYDNSHRLCVFRGDPLTATLETGERQVLGPGSTRTMVGDVRPLVDGARTGTHSDGSYPTVVTVQALKRDRQSDELSEGRVVTMNEYGNCPMRENARFHRFRITISGGFHHAIGLDVSATSPAGRR